MSASATLMSPGSPFLEGRDHYALNRHVGHCHMCSTCAGMYIQNRKNSHSLVDDHGSVIKCTTHGVFLAPRPHSEADLAKKDAKLARKLKDIVNSTLLSGSSLFHTERGDPTHVESQIRLLVEAYAILKEGTFRDSEKLSTVKKGELVLYMELTYPIEKADTSSGNKITHPHVWIRTNLRSYGAPHTTIPSPVGIFCPDDFIVNSVKTGTDILEQNLSAKVYVKFYIDEKSLNIKRAEIDVDYPSSL